MIKKIFFILLIAGFFYSCQKTIDCISGAGEFVSEEYMLSDFDTLIVNDNMNIVLIQDTLNKLVISAYKKSAGALNFYTEDNKLILSNDLKCKFTQPKKNKILINLHVKRISKVRLNASAKLTSGNILNNENEIGLILNSKYNDVDLSINCRVFYFWNSHLGGGKMYLHGNAEFLKLLNVSLFSVDASDLQSDNDFIENGSKGDVYLNANKFLSCKITGSGNVYYYGNPRYIVVNDSLSEGKLIKLPD